MCGTHKLGAVEINYLDTQIQHYITGTLGSAATRTFPLFLLDNVVEYDGDTSQCCVLGYHNAMIERGPAADLRRGDVRQHRRLQG